MYMHDLFGSPQVWYQNVCMHIYIATHLEWLNRLAALVREQNVASLIALSSTQCPEPLSYSHTLASLHQCHDEWHTQSDCGRLLKYLHIMS